MDHLDIAEIISALDPSYWRVRHFDLIDSTQTSLVTQVVQGNAGPGDVYLAEFQSAGKGRSNRTFTSKPGDGVLLSTVIATPSQPESRWGWIPLITGVAACNAIFNTTGINVQLKWPNDLMIDDHKVGGIIAEKVKSYVVVGIGINCLQPIDGLPVPGATSLRLNTEERVNRTALTIELLKSLKSISEQWNEKPLPIENKYRQLSSTLERALHVSLPDGTEFTGRAAAISSSGALILGDGRELVAADVTHIRTTK